MKATCACVTAAAQLLSRSPFSGFGVQEGVPDIIPAEACYLGWQESLILLAKLVEAEIPA